MDQTTVGGVHVPGDSHTYTSHQQNGFHMSTSNTGTAGEDNSPRAYDQKRSEKITRLISSKCKNKLHLYISSVPGFSLTQELQGGAGCQFSSSPEESIFFQGGSFDRSLSHMSSVYTET